MATTRGHNIPFNAIPRIELILPERTKPREEVLRDLGRDAVLPGCGRHVLKYQKEANA